MTDAHVFAVQLDHLVRLLAERPAELDDQKLALHQLHAALARGGDVVLAATSTTLLANDEPQAGPPADGDGLRGRLVADGVRQLTVAGTASSADLLVTARALATTGGLVWLELDGVRVDASPVPVGAVSDAMPAVMHPTPAMASVSVPMQAAPRSSGAVGAMIAAPRPAPPTYTASVSSSAVVRAAAVAREAGLVNRGDADPEAAVLLRPTPSGVHRARNMTTLVAGLVDVADMRGVNVTLEEVTRRVEAAARDGEGAVVRDAFCALVRHELVETRQDVRLATRIAIRRLVTPHTMRLVASVLPRQPDRRDETLDALRAAPEVGADAAMEHLVEAESASDRRAYYTALVKLPADESVVLHMLGDPRWFVVRNAAELAGDLELRGTERALVSALTHEDARVHRAAAGALGRLATPAAMEALRTMLATDDRQVRAVAAIALADARWPHAAATLGTLLDEERDADVRHALLAALGRVASDEAVETLVAWAARGSLLRRTPVATRLAAVQALTEAATDRARLALGTLARDRDRQVAACAQVGLRAAGRAKES